MSNTSFSLLRVFSLVLFITAITVVIIQSSSAQNPTTSTEKTAELVNKNIQALKGLPESQLLPVMNYISTSLGVRCNFCHVNNNGNWDYASDEKGAKKTAREMILMTTGINKDVFKGIPEVSCYTCHRGRTSVVHTLSMPLPTPEPRPSPAASPGGPQQPNPTAEQIIEKYYQALGGLAAIEKMKSRVLKGTITTSNGAELGYELVQSGADSVLATITTPQHAVIQRGFNGTIGWEKSADGIRDLAANDIIYLRRYPDMFKDIKLKEQFSRVTFGGKQKIDGRDVYLVRGTNLAGKREVMFFDVETGFLVRRSFSTATSIGNIPEQVDFSDYRDVDGVKLPFMIRVSAIDPNHSLVRKFTEIKLNAPVDSKRFNKPA